MKPIKIVAIIAIAATLSACGLKADLYLPPTNQAPQESIQTIDPPTVTTNTDTHQDSASR
ncbi:MAG TPA: lipoprotein [Candidatus Aphodousia faecipullorum]|nr:lipoprotein [Candidatus Aphodousia faecipullorum]